MVRRRGRERTEKATLQLEHVLFLFISGLLSCLCEWLASWMARLCLGTWSFVGGIFFGIFNLPDVTLWCLWTVWKCSNSTLHGYTRLHVDLSVSQTYVFYRLPSDKQSRKDCLKQLLKSFCRVGSSVCRRQGGGLAASLSGNHCWQNWEWTGAGYCATLHKQRMWGRGMNDLM